MTTTRRAFARDTLVATLILAGFYGLGWGVQFQPAQLPGYLLIVGFDAVERVFGGAGAAHSLLFAVYVFGLGSVGAAIAGRLRSRSGRTPRPWWRTGMAGAVAVLGSLSLLFAVGLLIGTGQRVPVLITGTAGTTMLAVAGWLAGVTGSLPRRG